MPIWLQFITHIAAATVGGLFSGVVTFLVLKYIIKWGKPTFVKPPASLLYPNVYPCRSCNFNPSDPPWVKLNREGQMAGLPPLNAVNLTLGTACEVCGFYYNVPVLPCYKCNWSPEHPELCAGYPRSHCNVCGHDQAPDALPYVPPPAKPGVYPCEQCNYDPSDASRPQWFAPGYPCPTCGHLYPPCSLCNWSPQHPENCRLKPGMTCTFCKFTKPGAQ